jgi:16S rRNA (guanine527-N7)-methyltransferase
MLTHHLLDSLAVVPYVRGAETILDVGSGAGLPGIPLALALPQARVTLLDSNQKKTTFLRQVKMQLALANVEVVCERVEKYQVKQLFSVVLSRAFAELQEFAALAGHLVVPNGQLIAMKGADPTGEIGRLKKGFVSTGVARLTVPGLDAERHLVFLKAA